MADAKLREHHDAGLSVPFSAKDALIPRRVIQPLQRFLHTEIAGGIVLVVAAAVALVWANSSLAGSYTALWETELGLQLGPFELTEDLRHWINDLLMALFFFVVGLEIKREFVRGELADPRAALLPVVAALGGMIVPALLYTAVNLGGPGMRGWGVPMATDIAFAVGVLALVGSRAPASLKIFLLTLAIADDIGAILVIAVFYTDALAANWLTLAALTVVAILLLQRAHVRALAPYVVAAGVLWLAVFESGVHATIAGVVLGLLTPARPFHVPDIAERAIVAELEGIDEDGHAEEREEQHLLHITSIANEALSPLARLEHRLHPWSAFVVLPLFALANAGVVVRGEDLGAAFTSPVTLGVIAGLVLGKPLGVMAFSWLAVRLAGARLPRGVGWLELAGVGLLAGIGFTVAVFIAGLAFVDAELQDAAKIGILAASVLAALLGAGFLAARDAAAHDEAA
jgi:NhaA family Na+:H+ antiporter